MSPSGDETTRDILTIEEAAALLGVSVKTFNKVLHSESIPARKIGREWKFSRKALIEWVGNGRSGEFYRDSEGEPEPAAPLAPGATNDRARTRRTAGWQIELD